MNYLKKHWRGECSLATSFWVNTFAVNVVISLFQAWLGRQELVAHPVLTARLGLGYSLFLIGLVYPWQIVGLMRAATHHIAETQKRGWASVVQLLIVLGVISTYLSIERDWAFYRDVFEMSLGEQLYTDYQVALIDNGTLIHLKGEMGFGISKQVKQLLKHNPGIRGIILDSPGGRIYEGRELSKLILVNSLNTYSSEGCYSACALAFISGNERYLAEGANLAFHQYHSVLKALGDEMDMDSEQQKDLAIFQRRGVSQAFIERLFQTSGDDFWYPTIDEMTAAGVIHGIVNPSTLKKVEYGDTSQDKIEAALTSVATFQALKRQQPELYNTILEEMTAKFRAGASNMEIQGLVADYMMSFTYKALPHTSDRALFSFVHATIGLLTRLDSIDPILCLKDLYPDQFGPLDTTKFLTDEEVAPLLKAMALIIDEQSPGQPRPVDSHAGQEFIEGLHGELGDDINYLDTTGLSNSEDYSRACNAVIHFYQLALQKDQIQASNALRFAFTQ